MKTMKFYIDVKDDTKIAKAQDLSKIVIENLNELGYLDDNDYVKSYLIQSNRFLQ